MLAVCVCVILLRHQVMIDIYVEALPSSSTMVQEGRYIPTAVNFDRTCMIIIRVMISAKMCMKPVAPWNMIVFANSTVRE